MSPKVSGNEPRAVEAILRSDFYSFIQAIFPLVSPNGPLMANWHLEAIAYALTRVLQGEVRRLIITVPPRSLKSICASVALPAFALGIIPGFVSSAQAMRRVWRSRIQGVVATSCARGSTSDCFRRFKSSWAETTRWSLQPRRVATGFLPPWGHLDGARR
jgi:hypothetical protein